VTNSLRLRLLAGTLAIVTLIWLALAFSAWQSARHEAEEIFDAHLAQTAALLAVFVSDEADELDEHLPSHRYARKVAFQIWEDGKKLLTHSLNAPDELLSPVTEGFSDATSGGQEWRVYSLWDTRGRYLIQVAEARAARASVSRELASHLMYPLAVALPLLALALVLLISGTLAPLSALAARIGERTPDRLDAIPLTGSPRELHPLLNELNRLMGRVAGSLEQERRFTADAAHELRTPLAAIRTHAQVAQTMATTADQGETLQQLITAADRASHLVGQLLTLARVDAGANPAEFVSCDLRELCITALADAAPAALQRNIDVELTDGPPLRLSGNPALLAVLLRNLVDNAVRYSPPQARVCVACGERDGHAVVEVFDQGPGIAPVERSRVLDRFYRIPGSGVTGSGLGLSIASRIAELHGARLELDDGADGKGLCVRVVFFAAPTG
jgi:two-component system sensor histidine kinase QseC